MKNRVKLFRKIRRRLFLLAFISALAMTALAQENLPPKGIPEGYTVIDGDILMPTAYVEAVLKGKQLPPSAPQATYSGNVWRVGVPPFEIRGVVPFEFDANVTA